MAQKVLLDTNLLVLLIVGLTSPHFIAAHKRLDSYSRLDFDALVERLAPAKAHSLVVTPHVMAEASNLLALTGEPRRSQIMEQYRIFLEQVTEVHIPARRAAKRVEFVRLGLSDAALLDIQDDEIILLTADAKLHDAALRAGRNAESFSHARDVQS